MEVTLEITDYCSKECDCNSTCANKRDFNKLSVPEIIQFLNNVDSDNTITRINIYGGEPLYRQDFYEIVCLCKSYTNDVWIYTNAITNESKVEDAICNEYSHVLLQANGKVVKSSCKKEYN